MAILENDNSTSTGGTGERTAFGKEMREKHFLFADGYVNLNHGTTTRYPIFPPRPLSSVKPLTLALRRFVRRLPARRAARAAHKPRSRRGRTRHLHSVHIPWPATSEPCPRGRHAALPARRAGAVSQRDHRDQHGAAQYRVGRGRYYHLHLGRLRRSREDNRLHRGNDARPQCQGRVGLAAE